MSKPIDSSASTADATRHQAESLSGENHPLAAPEHNDKPAASQQSEHKPVRDVFNGAVEIVTDANGKEQRKSLGQLSAGDHTIQLKNKRQFLMHVPETDGKTPLPVMFVISGSAEPQWKIKDFAKESGMNQYADDPEHKFITVYPLAQKHFLGVFSKEAAWGWNSAGTLLDQQDLKHAGYSDLSYVNSIVDLVPKLASVDGTHKDWGAVGFSQGGLFLNSILSHHANLFPSVGLVGTSMQKDYEYKMRPGNAHNVAIVNLHGDKETLPVYGNLKYDGLVLLGRLLRESGHKKVIERMDPLAAINNLNQDPKLQEDFYSSNLFSDNKLHMVGTKSLATPADSETKDSVTAYRDADPNPKDPHMLTVFRLMEAKHSYPGPERGARTNAQEKYTEFDASKEFVNLFNQYNDAVHQK